MIRRIKQAGAFCLATLLGFAAQAATLDVTRGGVLVSRAGGPYEAVDQPIHLQSGDSILVDPGGAARVVYANGCAVEVQPGMVFTVSEPPICYTGSNPVSTYGSLKDTGVIVEETDYTLVGVGAVVVVGGVGIALAVTGDDDNGKVIPISP